jgi:hypothetical protein
MKTHGPIQSVLVGANRLPAVVTGGGRGAAGRINPLAAAPRGAGGSQVASTSTFAGAFTSVLALEAFL